MSVIITGMHRSGTSAIARIIDDFGLRPGAGPAMVPAADNPRGFFERRDVNDFNDAWLSRLGGSWWAPPPTTAGTWRQLDEFELNAARAQLDLFDIDGAPWYSKDPRTALLLPLWDRLALREHPVIVCTRHPGEVAASLWLRNGLSSRRALALWAVYTAAAVNNAGDRPALVVDYAAFLEEPLESIAALEQFLQETGHGPGPAWSPERAAGLLEAPLRRAVAHRWNEEMVSNGKELVDLYRDLTKRHGQSLAEIGHIALPAWVEEVLDELRELLQHERKQAAADDDARALRAERDRLRAEASGQQADELRSQLLEAQRRLDDLTRELAAERGISTDRATQLDAAQAENTKRRIAMTEMSAELERRRARAHRAEALVAEWEVGEKQRRAQAAELLTVKFERDNLSQTLERTLDRWAQTVRAFDRVVASHSWRWGRVLTAPARLVHGSNGVDRVRTRFTAEQAHELAEIGRSGLLDEDWYRATYPDVAAAGADPLEHFVAFGWREGRDPGPLFSVRYYLERNPDVAEGNVNPLIHYLAYGRHEGRWPRPDFDPAAYVEQNDLGTGDVALLHEAARMRRNGAAR